MYFAIGFLIVNIESWKIIKSKGILIKKKWKDIFTKYGIDATISGIDSLPSFNFLSNNNHKYINYLTQEMLDKYILATNTIYVCTKHSEVVLNKYFSQI